MSKIIIKREVARVQPYARNGNLNQRKPVYDWHVWVDGRHAGICRTLRHAKELAGDFGTEWTIEREPDVLV